MRDLRVSFPKPCDERWEEMAPEGRARLCARCDKVVHDLSQFEPRAAEALLRRDPDACVRARIGADGAVELKPARGGGARRMVVAAAATAGLLTAAAPAFAKPGVPGGAIAGRVDAFGDRVRVTATSPSGQTFRTKVKGNGRFRIKGVPAGTYTLTFAPECGEKWTVESVVVGTGETLVPKSSNEGGCITFGMVRIEDDRG
jgi:hypothetical protein